MPLDPKLQKFTTASPIIQSYDWIDFSDGSGNKTFYLCQTRDSGGTTFVLVPTVMEPYALGIGPNGWSDTTFTAFDVSPFNSARRVKGTAYFHGQINHTGTNSAIRAYLVHYDGTDETTIGTTVASGQYTSDEGFNLSFDISETLFAQGDILRLYVKLDSAALYISIDPTETIPTGIKAAKLTIPFLID